MFLIKIIQSLFGKKESQEKSDSDTGMYFKDSEKKYSDALDEEYKKIKKKK